MNREEENRSNAIRAKREGIVPERELTVLRNLAFAKLREVGSHLAFSTALLFGSGAAIFAIYVLPATSRPELVTFCGAGFGYAVGALIGLLTPLGPRLEKRSMAMLRERAIGALGLLKDLKQRELIEDGEYGRRTKAVMIAIFGAED